MNQFEEYVLENSRPIAEEILVSIRQLLREGEMSGRGAIILYDTITNLHDERRV